MKTLYKSSANKSGVYKIINTKNERIYIGSAKTFKSRKRQHLSKLRSGKHHNRFLQADFNKCGEDVFLFEVIEVINSLNLRLQTEEKYITKYFDNQKYCYNICIEANSCLGRKLSEETKRKMSKSKKGLPSPMTGKKHSKATKKKMSLAQLGEKNHTFGKLSTKESNKKRSETMKKLWVDGKITGMKGKRAWNKGVAQSEDRKQLQSVKTAKQYDVILLSPNGEKVKGIVNAKQFAKFHGLNYGNFISFLKKKRQTCQGWKHE